jgi:two-component system, NtrC family, sensor histidine kinase PilS
VDPTEPDSQTGSPENRRRFVLLLYSRAVIITALLGSTIFFNSRSNLPLFSTSQILLYCIVAVVYLGTGGTLLWLKFGRINLNIHVQAQIVFDCLVAGLLVYLTGGVESPFCFFFALPVIITSIFFPRRGSFLTAGLSCLLLGAIFILENQGILPVSLDGRLEAPPPTGQVLYLLALNYTVFFAIAWLSGTLSDQLKKTGRQLERTEIDLERLEALHRDIVQSLRSGLLVVDHDYKVSLLNPVAEKILGVVRQESIGLPAREVFPSLEKLFSEQAGPSFKRTEVQHQQRADHKIIPVGLTMSVLKNPNDAIAGTLVHMQDLTERKQMEASVKQAEKMAALGEMAAGMAHEIRNPLASVSGAVQVLKESPEIGAEDRRLMGIILRETKRLDELLSDFLAYARPKDPKPSICSLKDLVSDTISVFVTSPKTDLPEVVTDLEDVHAMVDPDLIRQVFWNLLTNAADALPDEGKISVRLRIERTKQGSAEAVLEVEDNGSAIDSQLHERIFDPFFTTKDHGNGLGLATVNRIVEAHSGTIKLECSGQTGNIFIVKLPGVIDE